MGCKNWNFCWSDPVAGHASAAHNLIVTCRLHGIDPQTHLVDVLQSIASRAVELTLGQWKRRFTRSPLRSLSELSTPGTQQHR